MSKVVYKKTLTLPKLQREVNLLKKKIFIYETLNAEREIKMGRISGPFITGKDVIRHVKDKSK